MDELNTHTTERNIFKASFIFLYLFFFFPWSAIAPSVFVIQRALASHYGIALQRLYTGPDAGENGGCA